MNPREMAALFQASLQLTRPPVAVRHAVGVGESGRRLTACEALVRASAGETIVLSARSLCCALGPAQLGLIELATEADRKALERSLTPLEQRTCSVVAEPATPTLTAPFPACQGQAVVVEPLAGVATPPELVIFVCTLEQATQLAAWSAAIPGGGGKIAMEGTTCHRAIALPLATGSLSITLMSRLTREVRGYAPDEILVTVPYAQCLAMANAGHLARRTPTATVQVDATPGETLAPPPKAPGSPS